jgi:hypothetical protein
MLKAMAEASEAKAEAAEARASELRHELVHLREVN